MWPWPQIQSGSQRLLKCVQCIRSKKNCSNAPKKNEWKNLPAAFAAEIETGTPASSYADAPYIDWSLFRQAAGASGLPFAASSSGDSRVVESMLQPLAGASSLPRSHASTPAVPSHTLPPLLPMGRSMSRQPSVALPGQTPPSPLRPSPVMSRHPSLAPPEQTPPSPLPQSPLVTRHPSAGPAIPSSANRGGPNLPTQFPLVPATTWSDRGSEVPPDNFSPPRLSSMSAVPVTPPRLPTAGGDFGPVSPTLRERFRTISNDEEAIAAQRMLMDIRYRRAARVSFDRDATDRTADMILALRPVWDQCRNQIAQLYRALGDVQANMANDDFLTGLLHAYDEGHPDSTVVDAGYLATQTDREAMRGLSEAVHRLPPLFEDTIALQLPGGRSSSSGSFASRGFGSPSSRGRGEAGPSARRGSRP